GRVDDDRNVELRAQIPDRLEHRIVDAQAGAVRLAGRQSEVLGDLEADGAVADRGFELRDGVFGPARTTGAVPVHVREDAEPITVRRAGDVVDPLPDDLRIGARREVDEDAQIERIHVPDHL